MQSSDLLAVSHILARAFEHEASIGVFMHPYQSQYPDDMYLFFLRALRLDYWRGADHHLLVSYEIFQDGQERVTGFAHWIRKRGEAARTPWLTAAELKCVQAYNYIESLIYPNSAAEPSRTNLKAIVMPFIEHHWQGERADNWYLSLLGVDPQYEKQGYGRALVSFGFRRAMVEGIGCSVVSAAGRERFYRKCGFNIVAGRVQDEGGEANPLREVGGGTIMFADADSEALSEPK